MAKITNDAEYKAAVAKLIDDAEYNADIARVLGSVNIADITEDNYLSYLKPCSLCGVVCVDNQEEDGLGGLESADDWFGRGRVHRIYTECEIWDGFRTEFAPIGEMVAQWNSYHSDDDILAYDRADQEFATIKAMGQSIKEVG